jgi:hypothetical protein
MAKSYEPCYTRTDKSGGSYTTCEGAQKKRKAKAKKKKKVGVDETPEQNSQKAFLKLQSKKISQGFAGNNTGRINTGTLNPANPNLQVNPWEVQPEIQAQPITYNIDKELFLAVSDVMTQVGKDNLRKTLPDTLPTTNIAVYFKSSPYEDDEGYRGLTDKGWRNLKDHPNTDYNSPIRRRRDIKVFYKAMSRGDVSELKDVIQNYNPYDVSAYREYDGKEIRYARQIWNGDWDGYYKRKALSTLAIPQFSKSAGAYTPDQYDFALENLYRDPELADGVGGLGMSNVRQAYKDIPNKAVADEFLRLATRTERDKSTKKKPLSRFKSWLNEWSKINKVKIVGLSKVKAMVSYTGSSSAHLGISSIINTLDKEGKVESFFSYVRDKL